MFEFLLYGSFLFGRLGFPLLLLFFKIINLLLEHFDVKLELLLHLNVVTYLRLIVLQLLLILLRRQVKGVERRFELTSSSIVDIKAPWSMMSTPARYRCILLIV